MHENVLVLFEKVMIVWFGDIAKFLFRALKALPHYFLISSVVRESAAILIPCM